MFCDFSHLIHNFFLLVKDCFQPLSAAVDVVFFDVKYLLTSLQKYGKTKLHERNCGFSVCFFCVLLLMFLASKVFLPEKKELTER